eukprot:GHVR01049066.1.p1 GENE.GHVR01049066.1~~GHVR01049066.1.p1  ORF type:complete len:229 (+),score=73.45 GHVR01049066.1:448-1134(+)
MRRLSLILKTSPYSPRVAQVTPTTVSDCISADVTTVVEERDAVLQCLESLEGLPWYPLLRCVCLSEGLDTWWKQTLTLDNFMSHNVPNMLELIKNDEDTGEFKPITPVCAWLVLFFALPNYVLSSCVSQKAARLMRRACVSTPIETSTHTNTHIRVDNKIESISGRFKLSNDKIGVRRETPDVSASDSLISREIKLLRNILEELLKSNNCSNNKPHTHTLKKSKTVCL